MILGIGIDIAGVLNFDQMILDTTSSFLHKHFTAKEIGYSRAHFSERPGQHLAVRYAAKEAAIKALEQARSTRVPSISNVDYLDMEVVADSSGRPELVFKGRLEQVSKQIGVKRNFLSLSHDGDYSVAVVVLEG